MLLETHGRPDTTNRLERCTKIRLHYTVVLLLVMVVEDINVRSEKECVSCLYQILNPNAFSACSKANLPYMHYRGINDSLERAFSSMKRLFLITKGEAQ